jgi:molybdopterin converting factor small subunit
VATVHLPRSLVTLFSNEPPRRLDLTVSSIAELIDELDRRWPGMRDRLCDAGPQLREHINVYVDGERERGLDAVLGDASEVHVIPAIAGG